MAGAPATTCGSFSRRGRSCSQFLIPSLAVRSRLMCDDDPSRRCCKSWRNPLLIASAMISDATPAATPAIEIPVITPMTACLRLARRYREATNSSKRIDCEQIHFDYKQLKRECDCPTLPDFGRLEPRTLHLLITISTWSEFSTRSPGSLPSYTRPFPPSGSSFIPAFSDGAPARARPIAR